jgi:phosphotransferase system  glucose/maltose/N-acetylglucosamine-specific IIC component
VTAHYEQQKARVSKKQIEMSNFRDRFRASLIHLAICLVVAIGATLWLTQIWYAWGLMQAEGGWTLFAIILAVDITLGPLLTFIVFNKKKKSLPFDLAVIGAIQLAALIYGLHTLFVARPVYLAAVGDRFDVVAANQIDDQRLVKANASLPLLLPKFTGTKSPSDPKEKQEVLFSGAAGVDIGAFPEHHQPIENMREEILKKAQPISDLKKENPGEEAAIDQWVEKHGMKPDEVVFQGLKARAKDMAVILDAKTAKVIGIAPFKPWP